MAKEEKDGKAVKKERRPQALKRDLQNVKRRLRNRSFTSTMKTAIRQLDEVIEKKDAASMKSQLNAVYSLMDKGVKRGVYKINTASRTKSRLAARCAKA